MSESKILENNKIIEVLIKIKDYYDLSFEEIEAINYACNNLN